MPRISTPKIRAVVSLLLLVAFLVSFMSGLGLFVAPSCGIARQTGWTFLGLDKWQLEKVHTLSSFIMSGIAVLHLILNVRTLLCELRMLFRNKRSQTGN